MNRQMHKTREQTECTENVSMDTSYKKIDDQIAKFMVERKKAVDILIRELQNRNEALRTTLKKEKQDLERRLNDLITENTTLNDRLSIENENIDKYQSEIASIEQEKNLIESELVTWRKDNETVIEEKDKLANEIRMMKESAERMKSELMRLKTVKSNDKESNSTEIFKFELKRLNGIIADKQKQNESLRMENEKLKKRLSDTIQKMDEEKEKLTTVNKRLEYCVKNWADRDKENIEVIIRLASENEVLQARCNELNHQLINTTNAEAATMPSENSSLDEGLTSNDCPTAANITAGPSNQLKTEMKSESESETEVNSELETEMESESESEMVTFTSKQTKRHIDGNESDDKVDADVDILLAKRQKVEKSPKVEENFAISPASTRTKFEELQEHQSPQKNDTTSKRDGSTPCTNGNLHPKKRKRVKKSSKKRKCTKVIAQKSGSFKWCCNNCPALFDKEQSVKAHLKQEHHYATNRLIRQYECKMCPYSDDLEINIIRHLNRDHDENHWNNVKYNFLKLTWDW